MSAQGPADVRNTPNLLRRDTKGQVSGKNGAGAWSIITGQIKHQQLHTDQRVRWVICWSHHRHWYSYLNGHQAIKPSMMRAGSESSLCTEDEPLEGRASYHSLDEAFRARRQGLAVHSCRCSLSLPIYGVSDQ